MKIKIESKKTINEVADKLILNGESINSQTFAKRLNSNKLTAEELIALSKMLNFSIDEMVAKIDLDIKIVERGIENYDD
jgi:hypothetical protein